MQCKCKEFVKINLLDLVDNLEYQVLSKKEMVYPQIYYLQCKNCRHIFLCEREGDFLVIANRDEEVLE